MSDKVKPMTPTQKALARHVKAILKILGEDPKRDGLRSTPKRYSRAMQFLTSGYGADLGQIVGKAIFKEQSNEMVVIRDIELFSLCEHHLLPFYGKAHVAYVPDGKIIGLSKIPRIVDVFARRLQVQERLTTQIAGAIDSVLKPVGVAVIIEAFHLCMMMRGVEKQHSFTVTSSLLGVFKTDPATRNEMLHLLSGLNSKCRG